MKNFGCALRLALLGAIATIGLNTRINASESQDTHPNRSIVQAVHPDSVTWEHLTFEPMAKLTSVAELSQVRSTRSTTKAEFTTVQQLRQESNELNILQQRVENLQRENLQQSQQAFSTTTKLNGEVVFALIGLDAGDSSDDSNKLILGNRVRLNFDTSFTGEDRLRTRLQANNIERIDRVAGTDMARLGFQGSSENKLNISRLEYTFPLNEQVDVYLEAAGASLNDFTNTLNPFGTGSSSGTISRFGQRNPIYRQGGGSGLGINYEFNDTVNLTLGYLGDDLNDPEVGFNQAAYGAIAQLTFEFGDSGLGLTYIHSYNGLNTATGSDRSNDPFDGNSDVILADSFGVQTAIEVSDEIFLSGWVGFTQAQAIDLSQVPTANIFNWAVILAFPDLGQEGSVLGIVVGQPPKTIQNEFKQAGQAYKDSDTSLHLEAYYRLQLNEFIFLTPGILIVTNPDHNSNNDTLVLGTLRTTFSF